ncbi:hypothetical protein Sjap_011596 [Stephania japonica]|uniref:Uncharacterized protein n=1 Tax=Stephania japonica TaxID=461633 RepID=A0AAP0P5P7_9MAGN
MCAVRGCSGLSDSDETAVGHLRLKPSCDTTTRRVKTNPSKRKHQNSCNNSPLCPPRFGEAPGPSRLWWTTRCNLRAVPDHCHPTTAKVEHRTTTKS